MAAADIIGGEISPNGLSAKESLMKLGCLVAISS